LLAFTDEDDLETEDVYSAVAHCNRLAGLMTRLLGGEVYLYPLRGTCMQI